MHTDLGGFRRIGWKKLVHHSKTIKNGFRMEWINRNSISHPYFRSNTDAHGFMEVELKSFFTVLTCGFSSFHSILLNPPRSVCIRVAPKNGTNHYPLAIFESLGFGAVQIPNL